MRYLFGTYVLDTARRELRCAGTPVKLERKIYQALLYLVQHHDRLVTREELLTHLWPQTYVTEAAVTRCIRAVRRAMGDCSERQAFIQTRHGHGYRFVAPVVAEAEPLGAVGPALPAVEPRPVVGRQAEVARLLQAVRQAGAGARQLRFISAEAGVGKTTLIELLLAQLAGQPGVYLGRGQCVEYYGEGEPYLPVLEALGQLCRAPGGEPLRRVLRQYAPTWLAQLPWLVPEAERARLQQQVQGNTRARMLRELAEAIEVVTVGELAGPPPVLVLVLEDLHWSDSSTVELLAYCARRREAARLLVLGTYRPVAHTPETHPLRGMLQELLGHGLGEELELGLLSDTEVAAYAAARLGGPVTPALTAFVQARTEGNALFMVHILEDLVQRGVLRQEAGQWTVPPSHIRMAQTLPKALHQLLTRQFERCSPEARRLLETASVVGVRFATAAVAAGLQQEPDEVESLCELLAHQGDFLEPLELAVWPDGTYSGQYQFRHALYRQVVYERLSPARRMRLHRHIGERLEAGYGAQAQALATDLALHFTSARQMQRAAQYRLYAAANARHRQAFAEAADHLTAGLTLLATLPATPEGTRLTLVMQTFLAQILMVTRGVAHPDTQSALAQIHHRALQGSDTAERFDALSLLARMTQLQINADTTAARTLAEQCLTMAQRLRLPHCEARARFLFGTLLYERGEFAEAYEHCAQGITLEGSPPSEYSWSPTPYHPELGCLDGGAMTLWCLGYPAQAIEWSHRALALSTTVPNPFTRARTLTMCALLAYCLRDHRLVQTQAEAVLHLATQHGFPLWRACGTILCGWVSIMQRREQERLAQLTQGLQQLLGMGMAIVPVVFLALQAEAYAHVGQYAAALQQLDAALTLTDTTGRRAWEAELYRLKGTVLLGLARTEGLTDSGNAPIAAAEACYRQALTIAHRQAARAWELRAALSLSRLWQQHGRQTEARQLLTPVYDEFTEGASTPDLQEARAMLEALA